VTSDGTLFNGVFSFHVLRHIPGGWRQVVAETARVLELGGWFVFTDLVVTPCTGRLIRRLLPRFDQLEEMALQECLAQNGLRLEHYTYGQGEFMAVLGLMSYCTAVAREIWGDQNANRLDVCLRSTDGIRRLVAHLRHPRPHRF
jgi:hypothetical protein